MINAEGATPVITVKILGGLGNQMFQYALGRNLSIKNKEELRLDISGYGNQGRMTKRSYQLDIFNIKADLIPINKSKDVINANAPSLVKRIQNRLNTYRPGYVKERSREFDEKILFLHGNLYIDGDWQSEKYFSDIRDVVKTDFSLKQEYLSGIDRAILADIDNSEAVSLHVRRSDYINDPETRQFHGVAPQDYYDRAIDLIKSRTNNPKFFIFSDDIQWCRENFSALGNTTFISGYKDYEDMTLMSHCKHNIIANSSFSWWAAWLNSNPGKIVIAPQKWFNDERINSKDLVPESWTRL